MARHDRQFDRRRRRRDNQPREPDSAHAASPRPSEDAPPVTGLSLPPGVPVAHLRSASYGTFIYNRMIDRVEGEPMDGDLVAVVDRRGRPFGWAFYNSRSTITLRMFSHGSDRPDEGELARRVARAVRLRRSVLRLDAVSDAYRLIHAEGDGLSGLVADRFGEYVVIELFSLAMAQRLQAIQDALIDAGLSVRQFIVRADKSVALHEGFRPEQLPTGKGQDVVITENGVRFLVGMTRGHKTGFFCDQRENRLSMTGLTGGRSVLDVCCYTGGFACYAATIGAAASVTAVDLDENALDVARGNARLNGATNIEFHHADAFDFLRHAAGQERRWDVVILDPSKFVPTRAAMETGLRKYSDLNRLAAGVVAPEGLLLSCSCSGLVDTPTFVQTVGRSLRYAGRGGQILRITGAAADHPVQADTPESAYLKAVWLRLD